MAAQDFFIWGQGGTKKTPEQVAREREIADAILMKAGNTAPVGHWTQGAARVLDALGGVVRQNRASAAEADIANVNKGLIANLLSGSSGVTSPASSSAIPMTSAAGEVAATAPAARAVTPTFADDGTELGSFLSDPGRRATLPAGMRNNNPGNIKFVGQKVPGIVGPSVNTDQGDPQAVFATPEAGMNAMYQLALRKYNGGKTTANKLIAGNMGWTPGNTQAAANVAASMGLSPDDDINLNDPAMAAKFLRGLIIQEHGKSGALYPESMILSAITGQPTQVASATPQTATDAIDAVAPLQPVGQPDAPLSEEVAAYQQTPEYAAAFPGRVQPAQVTGPVQVAGGGDRVPMASSPTGINPAIIEALTNPQASPQTQRLAAILLEQEQGRQNSAMEAQMRDADPLRRLQIERAQLENEALRNPAQTIDGVTVGNRVIDRNTGRVIYEAPQADATFRQATPEEAQKYGSAAGQFGPDGKFYPINPPQGTALQVGPNGEITFNQGAGVKPLTEAQSKDTLYATRATNALTLLNQYEDNLMSLPEAAAGAIPFNLGNYAQSEEYQLARDAGRDFLATILRKDTGAAITAQEEDIYGKMFLPQPGDKPATIQAKRQRRALAVEAIKAGMPPTAIENMAKALGSVPASTDVEVQTDIPGVKIRRKN